MLSPLSYPKYLAWKDQKDIFEQVAAFTTGTIAWTGAAEPEQLDILRVSASFLDLLGTTPWIGRGFRPDEELREGPPAVILTHPFWESRFRSDPSVIGRTMTLDDRAFTVVGILPETFRFSHQGAVLIPLRLGVQIAPPRFNFLQVLAKFRPQLSLVQVRSVATAVLPRVNEASSSPNFEVSIVPLQEVLTGDSKPLLLALLGTVAFVLLIACANVANLLLARAASREKEVAIRASLGAPRIRLVRQLLTESILLSLMGGALGLAIAWWGLRLLPVLLADYLPSASSIQLDGSVLAFTALVAVLTGILFGLAPALQAGRKNLQERLKQGGRVSGASNSQRLRDLLVVAEIAFSLVLLAGAGLLLRSFIRLAGVDKGFETSHLLTMHINVSPIRYSDPRSEVNYLQQIVLRVRALTGVQSVGIVTNLPLGGNTISGTINIQGRAIDPSRPVGASKQFVAGDYFQTLQIPLLKGRHFTARDTADSAPVVIIDQAFARLHFPNEDPVGKRIDVSWGKSGWSEIVGVVREAKEMSLTGPAQPTVYALIAQKPELLRYLGFDLAVRTRLHPLAEARAVSQEIHQLDGNQVITHLRSMDQVIDETLSPRRTPMWLFGTFGGIALFLAAIGIYGVLSYYVLQRQQEIGTRLALGAQRGDILRLVMGHAGKLVVAGVVLGLAAAFATSRALASLLYGVQPTDGPAFLGASLLLATLAMLACGIPALRATRIDPLRVLRED